MTLLFGEKKIEGGDGETSTLPGSNTLQDENKTSRALIRDNFPGQSPVKKQERESIGEKVRGRSCSGPSKSPKPNKTCIERDIYVREERLSV